jgi:signal transduction histidine kinase
MRRRLLLIYLSLFVIVVAALAATLAITIAVRDTQTVYIDRQGDAAWFASLAESALRTGQQDEFSTHLAGYDRLYGIAAELIDRDGNVMAASRTGLRPDEHTDRHVAEALAGERAGLDHVLWPWKDITLVVAEPVGSDGEVIGAVLTISPTAAVRGRIARAWALLAVGSIIAIGLSGFAAWPVTGWILRPVRELDDATHDIADGRLAARVRHVAGPAELRRLAESFNTMADTVTRLLERQRTFVSYASHQLRNPLAALRLRVENLTVYLDRAGREEHALTLDEVDRLTRICDGLLALARADAVGLTLEEVDAATVAAGRVDAWGPLARRAGITLRRSGVATAPATAADVIDQVLDALIDNAVKFAGSGATITIRVDPPAGGWVELHVVDNGPGLPDADLAGAARPFWRDPGHGDRPGSGLGLAIAATLVEACGGTLDLSAATPHGLHVRLRLRSADQGLASR